MLHVRRHAWVSVLDLGSIFPGVEPLGHEHLHGPKHGTGFKRLGTEVP